MRIHIYIARKVADTKSSTILPIISHFVAEGSTVVTDESSIYNGLDARYTHVFVCHREKEYSVGSCTTNGIEGFWGISKRLDKRSPQTYISVSHYSYCKCGLYIITWHRD